MGWDDIAKEWFKLECEKILSLWNQLGYIWHWCDFGGYHGDHLKGKLTFYGNFHAISSKCVRTQLWGNVILIMSTYMKKNRYSYDHTGVFSLKLNGTGNPEG